MKPNTYSILTALLLMSAPLIGSASSIRCDGTVISQGDTEQQLLDACGSPESNKHVQNNKEKQKKTRKSSKDFHRHNAMIADQKDKGEKRIVANQGSFHASICCQWLLFQWTTKLSVGKGT